MENRKGENMDEKFLKAVKTYYHIVEEACNLLVENIVKRDQVTILNKFELYDYLHKKLVLEYAIDERKYFFHGGGCTVYINDIPMIEWDFGYRSWWCGIDPFKMAETLKSFSYEETEYYDRTYIKNECEHYLAQKELYLYRGQYYIDLLKIRCRKMKISTDYERMIVEYKGISKSYLKCKSIDKFIRKSINVYDGIDKLPNNYTLVFLKQNVEIARILYNDIAYPASAVKIMNGEIIRPHMVELWKQ